MGRYMKIKNLREDRDFTQDHVAKSLGMYKTTYVRYEKGERELPFSVAIKIANFYKVSLDYLASEIETE